MILCCGEALIDFVPILKEHGYRPQPGGSILNVAVGLGRLQTPVGMFTKLSNDFFGQLLVRHLEKNNVNTGFLLRGDGPATLAFVSFPQEGQSEPEYVFYANQATDRSIELSELPTELPPHIYALHFGSISLLLEPGASSLEHLMRRESGRHIISLDPNIRPSLIPDHAAYRRRFKSWLNHVDLLRLSKADLEWLYPQANPKDIITQWLEDGRSLCFLTLGTQGAMGFTNSGITAEVPAPPIKLADTVGAGDAFQAAVLAFLYKNGFLVDLHSLRSLDREQLEACLSYAVRAAAINCSSPGADPPYLEEMDDLSMIPRRESGCDTYNVEDQNISKESYYAGF